MSALLVSTSRLAENDDYNLSADRYREVARAGKQKYPMVSLGEIASLEYGFTASAEESGDARFIRITDISENGTLNKDSAKYLTLNKENKEYLLKKGDLLVARTGATYGKTLHFDGDEKAIYASYLIRIRFPQDKVLPKYYWSFTQTEKYWEQARKLVTGGGQPQFNGNALKHITFPLPPLETQRQIVDEIAAHQRIIDGARQVVEGWKPDIEIEFDENWEVAKLDELCEIVRGSSPRPRSNPKFYGGNIPRLMVADVTRDGMYVTPQIDTLTEEGAKQSRPMKKGDLVMAVSGQPGLCGILTIDACIHDGFAGFRNLNNEKIMTEFAYHYLMSQREANDSQSVGAIFKNLNTDQLRRLEIPLPPLEVQREIVARIEHERSIVEGNRELIRIYEEKVKKVIGRVWEG